MTNHTKIIPISPEFDDAIAKLIRCVLVELGVPKVGTAYEDKALDALSKYYEAENENYFLLFYKNQLVGGTGIGMADREKSICELQKMYFLPEARGKGWGKLMMQKCLDFAEKAGYKQCYIETLPYMKDAQKLYVSVGFRYIDYRVGNTGHYSCDVWMLKDLV
jgi:putative acetyltransferase